jgi:hypothetical protein
MYSIDGRWIMDELLRGTAPQVLSNLEYVELILISSVLNTCAKSDVLC